MIRIADDEGLRCAVEIWRAGGVVGVPAETVYGLAADALSVKGVASIFACKNRPSFNPLILHIENVQTLAQYAVIPENICGAVRELTGRFWPGPLTLVLPRRAVVPDLVCAGLSTAAFRSPAHPVFQRLLRMWGGVLAAPSANRSGRISPTSAAHVESELGDRVSLILDAGECECGIESTVVRPLWTGGELVLEILRPGPVTAEQLGEVGRVSDAAAGVSGGHASPGMSLSHYAPDTPVQVLTREEIERAVKAEPGTKAILWFKQPSRYLRELFPQVREELVLAPKTGSALEAAGRLYGCLRDVDASGAAEILVELVPREGLGVAILDRLQRAASPR